MQILVATDREVLTVDAERGTCTTTRGIDDQPRCLAADALVHERAWRGTLGMTGIPGTKPAG